LPDGGVLVAGGGRFSGVNEPTDQLSAEIFAPPYLFRGPRPVIASAPTEVSYAQIFNVQTPDATRVSKAVLVAPGSVTHGFDQNQRYVELSYTASAGGVSITAPASGNLAPPGKYMLFLIDNLGVPSIAAMIGVADPGGL
jgi:hypothetical protein